MRLVREERLRAAGLNCTRIDGSLGCQPVIAAKPAAEPPVYRREKRVPLRHLTGYYPAFPP